MTDQTSQPESEGCCCSCKQPVHKHSQYGETCARCGKHRSPTGEVNWVEEDWEPAAQPESERYEKIIETGKYQWGQIESGVWYYLGIKGSDDVAKTVSNQEIALLAEVREQSARNITLQKMVANSTKRTTSVLSAVAKVLHGHGIESLEQDINILEHLEEWDNLADETERLSADLQIERERVESLERVLVPFAEIYRAYHQHFPDFPLHNNMVTTKGAVVRLEEFKQADVILNAREHPEGE